MWLLHPDKDVDGFHPMNMGCVSLHLLLVIAADVRTDLVFQMLYPSCLPFWRENALLLMTYYMRVEL
jgi:hypothetical protein